MNTFILPTGRTVSKDALFCVATKCNGRWSTKFFKSRKGADNELRFLLNAGKNVVAYYGIEDYRLIKPEQLS